MADTSVKEGDKVSWSWGSGQPGGTVAEVKTQGEVTMESHRGNEIKKNAEPDNPAVRIERPGNDVVKRVSEIDIEKKGPEHSSSSGGVDGSSAEKKDEEKKEESNEKKADEGEKKEDPPKVDEPKAEKKTNGEAHTGDKRSAEDNHDSNAKKDDNDRNVRKDDDNEEPQAKKAKTDDNNTSANTNGVQNLPKKKGRPAKGTSNSPKDTKKRPPKRAATESGEPRRSGRVASRS